MLISAGALDGEWMSLKISVDGRLLCDISDWQQQPREVNLEICPPAVVNFSVSGKKKFDTKIDLDGNILQDKFIRVDSLCINGTWIKKYMMQSRVFDFTAEDGSKFQSNYFGSNGQARLVIPEDLLEFWLDLIVDQ
jgi:hypothetical protein